MDNDGWEVVGAKKDTDGWEVVGSPTKANNLLALDLTGGLVETATTGVLDTLGSIGAGVLGAGMGAIDPHGTAKGGWDALQQAYGDSVLSKTLAPQTDTGKAISTNIGKLVEAWKEHSPEAGKALVNAIPFVGEQLSQNPNVVGAVGALGSAIPELSTVTPFLGGKGKAAEVVKESTKPSTQTGPQTVADIIRQEAESQKAGWEPVGSKLPDTIPVTPEGQGVLSPQDLLYKQMAEKRAAAEQAIAPTEGRDLKDPFGQMKQQLDTPQSLPKNPNPVIRQMADKLTNYEPARSAADDAIAARQAALEQGVHEQRARDEAVGPAIDNNPRVVAAEERLSKQEQVLFKLAEAQSEGRATSAHIERALEDIKHLEEAAKAAREDAHEGIKSGTTGPDLFPGTRESGIGYEKPFNKAGYGGMKRTNKQSGIIDPSVFKEGFEKLKQLADGTWLRAYNDHNGFQIEARKDGHIVSNAVFDKVDATRPTVGQNLEAFSTATKPEFRGKGYASAIYKFASELGNDIQKSDVQTQGGRAMWEGFERNGLSKDGIIPRVDPNAAMNKFMRNKERGAVWAESRGKDDINNPRSDKTIAERKQARNVAANFPVKDERLSEFAPVKTKEEALALSQGIKDVHGDIGQKSLGSGINFQAIMTNSPAFKFARTVFNDARSRAAEFSREFITARKDGISNLWSKMDSPERVAVITALQEAGKHKMELSERLMDKLGFSENQRQFAKTFYAADKALLENGNRAKAALGQRPVEALPGHFPGIFTGAYKSIVMDGKKTIGVISVDTRAQLAVAKDHYAKEHPNAVFMDKERASLTGAANRYYSDIFSGMSDVLQILSKEDPRFQEVQELVGKAITESNNRLYGFNVHELAKKGVSGNEGNRPWLSPERNAADAFKALVRYFEEGAMHHELQVPLQDVRDLMNDPKMQHLPNTLQYLDAYTKKVTGDDVSPLGRAMNTIIDTPFKLLPTISWEKGILKDAHVEVGVGPGVPLKMAGATKNFMSQVFMGWGNYMFTAAQLVQPLQTALPFMQLAAGRLGLNPAHVTASMGRGAVDFMLALTEDRTGAAMEVLPDHMRTAYAYAKQRGMLQFSELENAYQGTKSAPMRIKDNVANINMSVGEIGTRTPMLMAFTDLLHKAGIETEKALPIAENLANFSMIDYHAWERPSVYGKLGVMGNFAGGLTTFKHGLVSQQIKLAKEFVNPTMLTHGEEGVQAPRQALPAAAAIMSSIAFAGITGTPFYSELDSAYQYLTNKFGGESKTIRESFLEKLPEWANSGVVSAASGLNLQGKFSSAEMFPHNVGAALSPQLDGAYKIASDMFDMLKEGADTQSIRNLVLDTSPGGPVRGTMENIFAKGDDIEKKQPDGSTATVAPYIGRDSKPIVDRTPEEWKTRALTGLRSQSEALDRESLWSARTKQFKDTERQKQIKTDYERAILNGTIEAKGPALEKEFQERKGDLTTLLQIYQKAALESQQTQKERLQGIPNSAQGVNRYEYYNK